MIGKFRKKPVEVEAMMFIYDLEVVADIRKWAGSAIGNVWKARTPDAIGEMQIGTLEDGKHFKAVHIATEGDWIIKGVRGEFYACKPDIFWETYESV